MPAADWAGILLVPPTVVAVATTAALKPAEPRPSGSRLIWMLAGPALLTPSWKATITAPLGPGGLAPGPIEMEGKSPAPEPFTGSPVRAPLGPGGSTPAG